MKTAVALFCVAILGVWAPPLDAAAQIPMQTASDTTRNAEGTRSFRMNGRAHADTALFSGSIGAADLFIWPTLMGATFQLLPALVLEAQFGFTYGTISSTAANENCFRATNGLLAAYYALNAGAFNILLGGGLTLPFASYPDDLTDIVSAGIVHERSAAMWGYWNIWMWEISRFSLVLSARAKARFGKLEIGGETDFGLGFDTAENSSRDTLVTFQLALYAAFWVMEKLLLGMRLQTVAGIGQNDDDVQFTMMPFAQLNLGAAFVFSYLTLNLNHPAGFAFDRDRVWAFHAGGGFRF